MHKAEQILEAITTVLTGLTTTGDRVERDAVYPPEQCPALSIVMGAEQPIQGRENLSFQDSALDVDIIIQVKSDATSTQLNQIKAEVYAAMMANRTLGLDFVFTTVWQGDSAPDPSGDGEIKTTRCTANYYVAYRHSLTSKEA